MPACVCKILISILRHLLHIKNKQASSAPDLRGELLRDLWQIVDTGLRLLQRHNQEILKELPLVELLVQRAAPAAGAIVVDPGLARPAQYGLNGHKALAVSWTRGGKMTL